MKKKIVFGSLLLVIVAGACAQVPIGVQVNAGVIPGKEETVTQDLPTTVPETPTRQLPTATTTPLLTLTSTLAPTKMPTQEPLWTPIPPELVTQLETLTGWIYPTPLVNCAQRIRNEQDLEHSCSTEQKQSIVGWLTVPDGTALVLTGDEFTLTEDLEGRKPFAVSPAISPHRLWVVVNDSGEGLELYLNASHGVFIGWFRPTDGVFHQRLISHLRNLHLNRFLIGPQPREFQPTPVANCDSPDGCNKVEVVVVGIDARGVRVISYGLYDEFGEPYWQPEDPPILGIP